MFDALALHDAARAGAGAAGIAPSATPGVREFTRSPGIRGAHRECPQARGPGGGTGPG